jgi:CHAT domain-containing protein
MLLIGEAADRSSLCRQLPEARVVHLATHGYFADKEFRSLFHHDASAADPFAEPVTGRNPLLLSGLVLAGANLPGGGHGILTGEEVAELDLGQTELVVLSACETARGELAGGEGVFSLQRAFGLAGVRTTVASLWKVDDAATAVLMSEFYANLWQKKLSKLEALRQAQLAVLNDPGRISAQRNRLSQELAKRGLRLKSQPLPASGRAPPVLWAAFVLNGDIR